MLAKSSQETLTFRDLTYYRIGGQVSRSFFPQSIAELQSFLTRDAVQDEMLAVIGAGSNTLCSDEDFDGTVVSCRNMRGVYLLKAGEGVCSILVEAGLSNTECAQLGLELGFKDLAWMHRMPGQLGATVRMNARCFGGEISQVVRAVFSVTDCGLLRYHDGEKVFRGYKDTVLMELPEIVTAAIIELRYPANRDEILAEMQRCEEARHLRHHFDHPSCGSAFKNNYSVGRPSGQIFDELGLKGLRIGEAGVSEFHGNFIFNYGHAKAHEVLSLAAQMRQAALTKGYELSLEVEPMGVFDRSLAEMAGLEDSQGVNSPATETMKLGYLKRSEPLDKIHQGQPRVLIDQPFALWPCPRESLQLESSCFSLGLVRFRVVQLLPFSDDLDDESGPLLRFEFLAEGQEPLNHLLQPPPAVEGFQDRLWESSVFEVFVHDPDGAQYLELEIHNAMSWLSLHLVGPRKRALVSVQPQPLEGVKPWRNTSCVGFDVWPSVLKPLAVNGRVLVGAAYTGVPTPTGSLESRVYAVSPPRSRFVTESSPDFHRRDGLVMLRFLPGA